MPTPNARKRQCSTRGLPQHGPAGGRRTRKPTGSPSSNIWRTPPASCPRCGDSNRDPSDHCCRTVLAARKPPRRSNASWRAYTTSARSAPTSHTWHDFPAATGRRRATCATGWNIRDSSYRRPSARFLTARWARSTSSPGCSTATATSHHGHVGAPATLHPSSGAITGRTRRRATSRS